jgi:hypothetical protein
MRKIQNVLLVMNEASFAQFSNRSRPMPNACSRTRQSRAADARRYAEDVIDLTLNEAIPFYNRTN